MTRIKILEIYATVLLIAVVVALLYVWMASPLGTSDKVGITMAISTVALVIVTSIYAWHTRKMAEEMREQRYDAVRPVIDIIMAQTPEAKVSAGLAGQKMNFDFGLLCELDNIGLGPAVDIYSSIQIERNSQRFDFGTLAAGKVIVKDKGLTVTHDNNRLIIRVRYKDVFGRDFESNREVHAIKGEPILELGPLKHIKL